MPNTDYTPWYVSPKSKCKLSDFDTEPPAEGEHSGGVEFTHHDHTSTAIAFGAAFFGAGAVQLLTQIVQNSGGAALALGFDDLAVEHKTHSVGDLGHGAGGNG